MVIKTKPNVSLMMIWADICKNMVWGGAQTSVLIRFIVMDMFLELKFLHGVTVTLFTLHTPMVTQLFMATLKI